MMNTICLHATKRLSPRHRPAAMHSRCIKCAISFTANGKPCADSNFSSLRPSALKVSFAPACNCTVHIMLPWLGGDIDGLNSL
ncbi:Uncharacterized protein HZ326_18444 [Fusarium oxysporum f. sp. albedinis]|nr:Uncharacterized protein HZ326_18444 [Fusarium oxysporum f. sp. albedinis]